MSSGKLKQILMSPSEEDNKCEIDVLLDLTTIITKDDSCICQYVPNSTKTNQTFQETEIIPNISLSRTAEDKINLYQVLQALKQRGFCLTGGMISIYLKSAEDYVLFGADPIDTSIHIDLADAQLLKIRALVYVEEKYLKSILTGKKTDDKLPLNLTYSVDSISGNKKNRRTKERKIGYIIEKVNSWRKLYNGIENENGDRARYSLDQGAKIIGISKKSLDDYLLQLRLGRKYGFDFNANKDNKVGVLRSFVKEHRGKTIK